MKRLEETSWQYFRATNGAVATYAFAGLCALMPIWPAVLPFCFALGLVAFVIHHRAWQRSGECTNAWGTAMPYALALYALHVAGLAWSSNFAYAAFDLQIKAPLLLLPAVWFILPGASADWRALFRIFIAGNIIAVCICCALLLWRFLTYAEFDATQQMYGERWSVLIHPSYFALYLCFALALLFLEGKGGMTGLIVQGGILCIGVVLCGSKMGWALLPVVLFIALWAERGDRRIRRAVSALLVASAIGATGLLITSSGARERIVEAWHAAVEPDRHADATTSSEVRKLAWVGAWDVIIAAPVLGAGTGDVKDELMAAYGERGYTHLVERRINAHSQYLQLWAALGPLGLLLMVVMLLIPMIDGYRSKRTIVVLFFALNAINWTVESMLEVQAGTMFFTFFAFLLATGQGRSLSAPMNTPDQRT